MANRHIGSSFDSLLEEEGIKEEVHATATTRVLVWQIRAEMEKLHLSKSAMAKAMNTSRAQLDRLLDPENDKVQLNTIRKAARAVGRRLVIELA